MANVKSLVEAGFDEGLVKQAVDQAGFERKRGRGGLDLDVKGVEKVTKKYTEILTKLQAKVAKFNPEKLDYGDEPVTKKGKVEKPTPQKIPAPKPIKVRAKKEKEELPPEEEDEVNDEDQEDVTGEGDSEDDDE
jgi:hypothetical protein